MCETATAGQIHLQGEFYARKTDPKFANQNLLRFCFCVCAPTMGQRQLRVLCSEVLHVPLHWQLGCSSAAGPCLARSDYRPLQSCISVPGLELSGFSLRRRFHTGLGAVWWNRAPSFVGRQEWWADGQSLSFLSNWTVALAFGCCGWGWGEFSIGWLWIICACIFGHRSLWNTSKRWASCFWIIRVSKQ